MFIPSSVLIACFIFWPFAGGELSSKRGTNLVSKSQMKNDAAIEEIIGADKAMLISKAGRMRIYRLKPFTTEPQARQKKKKYFENYEVLGRKGLNGKTVSQLRSSLLDAGNYVKDDINKCTFAATIGFEISYKKDSVIVIISYPCKKLLFIRGGEELYRDVKTLDSFDRVAHVLFKDLPKPE